jgi:hypothetical protein
MFFGTIHLRVESALRRFTCSLDYWRCSAQVDEGQLGFCFSPVSATRRAGGGCGVHSGRNGQDGWEEGEDSRSGQAMKNSAEGPRGGSRRNRRTRQNQSNQPTRRYQSSSQRRSDDPAGDRSGDAEKNPAVCDHWQTLVHGSRTQTPVGVPFQKEGVAGCLAPSGGSVFDMQLESVRHRIE